MRRVTLEPKSTIGAHFGTHRAIYSFTDYELSWEADGNVSKKAWSKGEVHWHTPGEHAVANIGDSVAEWLVVEFLR